MKRLFSILSLVTLIALMGVFISATDKYSSGQPNQAARFLPGLYTQIHAVDRVRIFTPGNELLATLVKKQDAWEIEQLGGFYADRSKLNTLLVGLAQARVDRHDIPVIYARHVVGVPTAPPPYLIYSRFRPPPDLSSLTPGQLTTGKAEAGKQL